MADLDYTNYDFDFLVDQLVNRVKATDAWKDTYESAAGQMIIQFYAYIGNMAMYNLERTAEEVFWGSAQRKSSLINQSRLINYTPKRKVSSTGTLQFSAPAAVTTRVIIPQYTECQTANEVKFVTVREITIEPGATSNSISAIQGELVTLSYTADGSANQEYAINNTSVENDDHTQFEAFRAFRVLVDGIEWTKVTSFLSSGTTDTHYKVRAELDDTLTVLFGDNVNGKAPDSSSTVEIIFIQSDGTSGNVYQADQVTTLNDTISDEDGNEVSTITVTNTTNMSGGDEAEDLEEIRAEAPDVFATGNRLVTKSDFEAVIINYASVAAVNVWGENEVSPPNYDMFNKVRITILLDDWNHPDAAFKDTLATNLYDTSLITVKYEFIQATILYIVAEVDLIINATYSLSSGQAAAQTAIANQFLLGTTSDLGTDKYHSNIVDAVDSLSEIAYHHLTLKIRKALDPTLLSAWDYNETLEATPILTGSVEVYASISGVDTLMAVDDGVGGFTDLASLYVVTGTINYTTGAIAIEFEPDTFLSNVYVLYRQDSDGDIIVDNDQICKLYDTDVQTLAYLS